MFRPWSLLHRVVVVYKLILWSCFLSKVWLLSPPKSVHEADIQDYLDEQSSVADHLLKHYDKRFIPAKSGQPLNVTLQVVIADILKIDNMEAEMLIYIRQTWYDHRLCWNSTKRLKVREHFLDKIWLPDIRIVNLKDVKRFEGFGGINMNIEQDGKVYYSQLALIKTSCPMDLHKFPLDRQTCFLNFSSFAYTKALLNFTTSGKHVFIKHSKLPQFDLVESKEIEERGKVTICLTFQRRFGYYLMSIFLPSASTVILSWLVFFMEPSNVADRLALEITMTLTTVFLLGGINEGIVHVSYAKASDVFVIVSFGFIFLALLETMLVFRLSFLDEIKRGNRYPCTCGGFEVCYKAASEEGQPPVEETAEKVKRGFRSCRCTSWSTWIDRICLIMFPTMYVTFNIVYWKYYTSAD